MINPVLNLDKIFFDSIDNDYDHEWVEEAVFHVEKGSLAKLFIEIDKNDMWNEFFNLAQTKRGQWLVDISSFVPESLDCQVQVLVKLMSFANNEHSKVIFCQEASQWNWNKSNIYLVPEVINMLEQYLEDMTKNTLQEISESFIEVKSKLQDFSYSSKFS